MIEKRRKVWRLGEIKLPASHRQTKESMSDVGDDWRSLTGRNNILGKNFTWLWNIKFVVDD